MKLFDKIFQGDRVIWVIVALLALTSMLVIYSSTGAYAYAKYDGNNTQVLFRHLLFMCVGLVALYSTQMLKYNYYSRILLVMFWISIPLLIYTLFAGLDLNDAKRSIGLFGFSLQSSDFAKIALIGYVARELVLKKNSINTFKDALVSFFLPISVVTGLIFPENFSTAAMLFAACMVLLFVGRIKFKYLLGFVGIIVIAMSIYMLVNTNKEDSGRTHTWINRIIEYAKADDEGSKSNTQLDESFIAISSGGVLGKGPGRSTQRNFLQHPYSDFVYAIIIEEYGMLGAVAMVMLYLILLYRSIVIMLAIPETFGGYLSFGLAFLLVMQAMINMGVAVGLLPVTGQPLPFVSMGGSSMLFTGMSLGIILSVSKEVEKRKLNQGVDYEESTEL